MKIFQSSIFRALTAIVVGALLVKYPDDGVTWITRAIGALFLLSGIIALIAYWQARRHTGEFTITDQEGRLISGSQPTFPIVGAGSVILGYMLAAILIMGGITQLVSLVAARRMGSVPFGYWIAPSVILLIGIYVVLMPMETAELPLIILGWCSILYGVIELINALKIYNLRKGTEQLRVEKDESVAEEISSELGTGQNKTPELTQNTD